MSWFKNAKLFHEICFSPTMRGTGFQRLKFNDMASLEALTFMLKEAIPLEGVARRFRR